MAISPALRGISLILPRVKHGAGLLQHGRERFETVPYEGFRRPCFWPFLSNPEKITFSAAKKSRG